MKKIINPWEGLDGYMCFGCAPNNPLGDRKSTRLNSSHNVISRMPSSA